MRAPNNIETTVVSTRVRLARNLAGHPFPNRLGAAEAREIVNAVDAAASGLGSFKLYRMEEISGVVAQAICDDHLISAELAANRCGAALIDEESGEGKLSIMINEEDHLREQCILPGLSLSPAYRRISAVDDGLSRALRFAFDAHWGYLTACPTNLGTGMRASVMLFLPGLTRRNKMDALIREISRLGHAVRGVYGEGSAAEGYMYQVSNEVTLGVDEEYILAEVHNTALEIVNLEAQARKAFREDDGVRDACRRALGILQTCYRISYSEFLQRVSDVKLGAALGFLQADDFSALDRLSAAVRPANIDLRFDGASEAAERDKRRAAACRSALAGVRIPPEG